MEYREAPLQREHEVDERLGLAVGARRVAARLARELLRGDGGRVAVVAVVVRGADERGRERDERV